MKKKFLGYIAHRLETDEFLVSLNESEHYQLTGWKPYAPSEAYRFRSRQAAITFCIENGKGSMPAGLYDCGSTYHVEHLAHFH